MSRTKRFSKSRNGLGGIRGLQQAVKGFGAVFHKIEQFGEAAVKIGINVAKSGAQSIAEKTEEILDVDPTSEDAGKQTITNVREILGGISGGVGLHPGAFDRNTHRNALIRNVANNAFHAVKDGIIHKYQGLRKEWADDDNVLEYATTAARWTGDAFINLNPELGIVKATGAKILWDAGMNTLQDAEAKVFDSHAYRSAKRRVHRFLLKPGSISRKKSLYH